MQTIQRAAAVLIYPAMLCLSAACDRAEPPTTSRAPMAPRADLTTPSQPSDWLLRALSLGTILSDDPLAIAWTDEAEDDEANDPIKAVPFQFDPSGTNLVRARWLRGTGCPTNVTLSTGSPYMDPACATGDPKDSKRNEGLLLVKTGPTGNNASAGVDLKGVHGMTLSELGYDIRKPDVAGDPRGSHCGAGAPRFNIGTSDGNSYFLGCNSPPASTFTPGTGWLRLRWGGTVPLLAFNANGFTLEDITGKTVTSISIVFDEGQDPSGGPDSFGLAVLDNIDVNGTLVGRGPGN